MFLGYECLPIICTFCGKQRPRACGNCWLEHEARANHDFCCAHWVSQSEHRCTSGNFETVTFVERRFLYRLPQSSFFGSKPISKRYSIHQNATSLLRAVEIEFLVHLVIDFEVKYWNYLSL